MDLPKSSSEDLKLVAKATEGEPPTSIDPRLAQAVQHPQFRKTLLRMEEKIRKVLENPNIQEVEFPECNSSHLKGLALTLALHYRLEFNSTERMRVFARKTPDSKIPSVTLSGISELKPKDKLPILIKRCNGAASSSTLSTPELTETVKRARTLEERQEEYYKTRERIFNEPVPASSISPPVSSSTFPVVSSSISLVVSSCISPVHSKIVEEGDQDDLSGRHTTNNPVHDPCADLNHNLTSSIGRRDLFGEAAKEAEMDWPTSSSEDLKRVAKASEEAEKKPPTLIDPHLAHAVQHPQFRKTLLRMEEKIQQVLENPNIQEVEFPECNSSHLKGLARTLALHYRLEFNSTERMRVFARKTPDSKIPSVTLSGISEFKPKDKLPIVIKGCNGAASSSKPELTELEKRVRTLEEMQDEYQYYKARERIFNEPTTASSNSPPVSRSSVHRGMVEEGGLVGLTGNEHAATNTVHNPGADLNHNLTSSNSGTGMGQFGQDPTTSQQPLLMQNDAITFQHQAVQYEPRIEQPQWMQYRENVSQHALQYYGQSTSPHMLTPYGNYTGNYPYYANNTLYNPASSSNAQWPWIQHTPSFGQQTMQYGEGVSQPALHYYGPSTSSPYMLTPYGNYTGYYPYNANGALPNPAYSSHVQFPWVQHTQSFSQQPMRYQPGTAQQPSNSIIQNNQDARGAHSNARGWRR